MSFASPITLSFSSTGTGSVGATNFTDAAFTITALGDTANVASCGGACLYLDHSSASIDIDGVGLFSFVTATRTFDNAGLAGFSRAGIGGADLIYSVSSVSLNGWAINTSIGPITGVGSLLQWSISPVVTSGGTLVFDGGHPTVTFQASTVPEPASLGMVLGGLALAILKRMRG